MGAVITVQKMVMEQDMEVVSSVLVDQSIQRQRRPLHLLLVQVLAKWRTFRRLNGRFPFGFEVQWERLALLCLMKCLQKGMMGQVRAMLRTSYLYTMLLL